MAPSSPVWVIYLFLINWAIFAKYSLLSIGPSIWIGSPESKSIWYFPYKIIPFTSASEESKYL